MSSATSTDQTLPDDLKMSSNSADLLASLPDMCLVEPVGQTSPMDLQIRSVWRPDDFSFSSPSPDQSSPSHAIAQEMFQIMGVSQPDQEELNIPSKLQTQFKTFKLPKKVKYDSVQFQ